MSTITKTVFFNAQPNVVWSFLTEHEKLAKWYHHSDSDLKEGAPYQLFRIDDKGEKIPQIWGEVLEATKPKRLVYTFICEAFPNSSTTVICELEGVLEGTKLTLQHEGIAQACGDKALHMLMALDAGWDQHIADLRTVK